jgi:DNA-binding response OmpR family regulator
MADILIVDDDYDVAAVLAEVVSDEGHQVRVAHDGAEGLIHVAERIPDLVILDVDLPVLDGPGMARRMLLADHGQESVPIVLFSGVPRLHEIAGRVGTPYYVAKPSAIDRLLGTMTQALRESSLPLGGGSPTRG